MVFSYFSVFLDLSSLNRNALHFLQSNETKPKSQNRVIAFFSVSAIQGYQGGGPSYTNLSDWTGYDCSRKTCPTGDDSKWVQNQNKTRGGVKRATMEVHMVPIVYAVAFPGPPPPPPAIDTKNVYELNTDCGHARRSAHTPPPSPAPRRAWCPVACRPTVGTGTMIAETGRRGSTPQSLSGRTLRARSPTVTAAGKTPPFPCPSARGRRVSSPGTRLYWSWKEPWRAWAPSATSRQGHTFVFVIYVFLSA